MQFRALLQVFCRDSVLRSLPIPDDHVKLRISVYGGVLGYVFKPPSPFWFMLSNPGAKSCTNCGRWHTEYGVQGNVREYSAIRRI